MIIIKLTGGIGNQLFQYSIGRVLSEKSRDLICFDISSYQWDNLRTFELGFLNSEYLIMNNGIIVFKKLNFFSNIKYLLYKSSNKPHEHLTESDFNFDINFEKFPNKNVILEGYWQSEKYFNKHREIILKEVVLIKKKSLICCNFFNLIYGNINSVSMHIRRGDYLMNEDTKNYHGVLNEEYYDNAMDYFRNLNPNVTFFIFSDDKKYVNDRFSQHRDCIIVPKMSTDLEDLFLMSTCSNHIIANSTFSWWGAWLNKNKYKKVIAPKTWFLNSEIQSKTNDLYPVDWIKM